MRKLYCLHQLYSTIVLLFLPVLTADSQCTEYGVCKHFHYVPAPPGHTPKCAKPGNTFCEQVDHYPMQLIKYLIEKWGYDYNTLFSDESREEFAARKATLPKQNPYIYGGPPPPVPHGPVPQSHFYYTTSPPIIQPALSYGPLAVNNSGQPFQEGYPDRTYKIDPQLLTNALQQPPGYFSEAQFFSKGGGGFLYSAPIFTPTLQTNLQSVQWWNRYKRSKNSQSRKRRQAPPGSSTQLCPTTSSFIMPKAALNTRGNWMYTVNLVEVDDKYTQLVRSETCVSNQCNGLCTLPNGYTSRCEQKYVQKRLVALEGGGERLYSDVFWFPHCCVCQIIPN